MSQKLYVGNLSYGVNDTMLRDLFSACGEVRSAQVIQDRETGRSKGFGFVEMSTPKEATDAIEKLNGTEYEDRTLNVSEAKPREERSGGGRGGFGGGGGRGRGGFGGGEYGGGRR